MHCLFSSLDSRPRISGSMSVRWFCTVAALLLACLPSLSQTTAGRILGAVTDQSGGALVGATVIITDLQRDVSRTLTTDESGEYVVPDLAPGMYKVAAQAKGFKTAVRQNVQLEVAKDLRLDFELQTGRFGYHRHGNAGDSDPGPHDFRTGGHAQQRDHQ